MCHDDARNLNFSEGSHQIRLANNLNCREIKAIKREHHTTMRKFFIIVKAKNTSIFLPIDLKTHWIKSRQGCWNKNVQGYRLLYKILFLRKFCSEFFQRLKLIDAVKKSQFSKLNNHTKRPLSFGENLFLVATPLPHTPELHTHGKI